MIRINRLGMGSPARWAGASVALAAWGLGMLAGQPGRAQQYKEITPAKTAREATTLAPKVSAILRQTTPPSAADQKILDEYFKLYLYSAMTSTNPVDLGLLDDNRQKLFRQFLNVAKHPETRDYLNTITMQAMGSISKSNYHPAVRYNAALIIGQLDQAPAQAGGGLPTPLPAATGELVGLLENAEFNGTPVPACVKVAALVGLQRQTQFGVDAQFAERIGKAALAVATQSDPPKDISRAAYDWMRRLAVRVLANQLTKGISPETYDAVVKLVGNKKIGLDERCGIAESITGPMYEGAQGLDRQPMLLALGALARDVLAAESEEAQDYLDELLDDPSLAGAMSPGGFGGEFGGRGGMDGGFRGGEYGGGYGGEFGRGGMDGGYGMGMTMVEDLGPHFEKRRMLDRVMAVYTAASALAKGAPEDVTKQLGDLATPIKTVADLAVHKESTEGQVADAVVTLARDVNAVVRGWLPEEPAEEVEAEAEAGFGPPAPVEDAEPEAAGPEAPAEAAPAPAEEAPADAAPADAVAAPVAAGN